MACDSMSAIRPKQLAFAALLLSLSGCQSSGGVIGAAGKVADVAMEVIGLKKPEVAPQPRLVPLRLQASTALNADSAGRGLSVVAKIYKLKDANNFSQTSYETFLNSGKEKEALGSDLLEVKEVLLVPGQRYASTEKLAPEAAFIGIVVLFREPNPNTWRLAVAQTEIDKAGLTLGVQSCALKVIDGVNVKQTAKIPPICDK